MAGHRLKTSIATVSVSGDFAEKLAAISRAGFDGIEIFEQDFIAFDKSPEAVGKMVRDHGLEIMLFQPFRDFEGLPEPHRSRAFDRAERKFDLMNALGVDLLLVCSSLHPASLGGIDRAADDFAALGERARKKGIRVGYEALAWGRHINDHRDAWEVVRRADDENIGLIVDSFHTLGRQLDPQSLRAVPGDKIFFVQLADAPLIDMDLFYWSRHFRNMPGEGDLPVTDFMRAVAATGYKGPLSLEIFNDQFRGGSPLMIAQDGLRSLLTLMDDVSRAEPDICLSGPQMPPRATGTAVEFIEFTANDDEAASLGQMLASLGFAHKSRHVSKQVQHWQQGDINILINSDEEGYARSAYLAHGTCVCDICFCVDDARQAQKRAVMLGLEAVNIPQRDGELAVPAIKAIGGGLIHFTDKISDLAAVWETDFTPLPEQNSEQAAGLTRIDHIAQTMKYDEMLTWTLFYTCVFDSHKVAMVDVVDPGGLVRSRAIENNDGSMRITLNGAENQNTIAGRFITQTAGSGVQHLALNTDDIFATARQLQKNGFASLTVSENYYDDLAARFGLDDNLIARLKACNILYDQDETGSFYQLYSQAWGAQMFFEIVQRTGGYNGYGAANAPYRISAQRRMMHSAQSASHKKD